MHHHSMYVEVPIDCMEVQNFEYTLHIACTYAPCSSITSNDLSELALG